MVLDMQSMLTDPNDVQHLLEVTYPKAHSSILSLRLTDAEFLYTPSQIAAAAFHMADPSLTERWLASKLDLAAESKLRPAAEGSLPAVKSIITASIDPIVELVKAAKAGKLTDIEKVRHVDRRLKVCRNPEKDPNSSLYKKRQREKEDGELDKRQKKQVSVKQKEEIFGDPFN